MYGANNLTKKKMSKLKADPVLVRLSFEDVVVTKEQRDSGKHEVGDSYFVCYEDQDGRECDEDGNYI